MEKRSLSSRFMVMVLCADRSHHDESRNTICYKCRSTRADKAAGLFIRYLLDMHTNAIVNSYSHWISESVYPRAGARGGTRTQTGKTHGMLPRHPSIWCRIRY